MARFGVKEADNYGGQGGAGFFALKNDKDVATIRFMYEKLEDIEGYAVHEVEVDGKKRYVNCLRDYNQPIDDCPLCKERTPIKAKLFLHVYDEETGDVKIWDRGKTFFSKLSGLCARFNPLVSTVFEVERNGKKGDPKTTYETYNIETDETRLSDLPEVEPILGGLVLDKTYEEIEHYLDNGEFPPTDEEKPVDRNTRRTAREEEPKKEEVQRRRTSTSRRRNTEAF